MHNPFSLSFLCGLVGFHTISYETIFPSFGKAEEARGNLAGTGASSGSGTVRCKQMYYLGMKRRKFGCIQNIGRADRSSWGAFFGLVRQVGPWPLGPGRRTKYGMSASRLNDYPYGALRMHLVSANRPLSPDTANVDNHEAEHEHSDPQTKSPDFPAVVGSGPIYLSCIE